VGQACASPEGQALAVKAGAVAVLGWNMRSRDVTVVDSCARSLLLLMAGARALGVAAEMRERMAGSGVPAHARRVLEQSPAASAQTEAVRLLLTQVTPYRRDALNAAFAMAVLGVAACWFLGGSPPALGTALVAWASLLLAFARKFEHTHSWHAAGLLAVVVGLRHGAEHALGPGSDAAYLAALGVACVLGLSNGSSPQASDAMLAALAALGAASELYLGTGPTVVVLGIATFLAQTLSNAHDGGSILREAASGGKKPGLEMLFPDLLPGPA